MRLVKGAGGVWTRHASKTLTFNGTTIGDVASETLFTVTGEVWIAGIVAYCSTLLTGSGTLALGVTGSTALFIAATTATDIDAGEFWVDATPDANGVAIPAALKDIVITDNILATTASDTITAGVIRFDVFWFPVSDDGNLVAA